MDFAIRTVTINDYESLYSLWLQVPGMGLNDLDDSREGISRYLRRNPSTCFCAVSNGKLAGAILAGHDGRRGFIHHTAVLPEYQRSGIGSALVNTAMEALEKEGIHKVNLVAFRENQTGNVFWEKQGFTLRPDLNYRNKAIHSLQKINT